MIDPMNEKLRVLPSFEEQSRTWDEKAEHLQKSHPLKTVRHMPNMPGITQKTRRFLKIKSLYYLLRHDDRKLVRRFILKRPIHYTGKLVKSLCQKQAYTRENDHFYYGISSEQELIDRFAEDDSHLVIGFSYCQKPLECPSGRFTDQCQNDPSHPVCGQCPIGKAMSLLPQDRVTPLIIPTIHYIGEKMFALSQKHKKLLFLITACEMSLVMFADYGNMIGAKGIGIRLDGRICNTMRAFHLSEKGVKPGLTIQLDFDEFITLLGKLSNIS